MAEMINEISIPSTGAIIINKTIFKTPGIITDPNPFPATADPTKPPTSVCDELDGRPSHHVIRFQIIAADTAEVIRVRLMTLVSITPFPIVVATLRGKIKNARKLKIAANATAEIGDNTLVDTTVAIELAESWNPLMKSNIRTNPITIYKNIILNKVINL
jgi:hypothetical protein